MKLSKIFESRLVSALYIPIALLGLTILAYGPLVFSLGFYWDDWPLIWFGHLLGTRGYLEVLAGDRPFLAGVYLLTTSILGDSPIQWHIFGLITRWGVTLSAWWVLSLLWKNNKPQVFWIAALFAVYPGFKQQPISVIYSNGYLLLIAFFLSFGFTILAIRNRRRFWLYTALAIVFDLFCSFSTEYYFGLNLVRFVILFFMIQPAAKTFWQTIRKSLLAYIPYLISMLVFIVWRVFLFKFPTYQPQLIDKITSGDWSALGKLLYRIIFEPLLVGLHTWFLSFRFPVISDFKVPSQVVFWVIFSVGLLFSILILFYLPQTKNLVKSSKIDEDVVFQKSALWIGLASLVLPGIPYWVTNLPIELQFPWDRFTLAFMFGSAILVVWLLNWLMKSQNQQRVVVALFISMAIASHVSNTITYQREWQTQKDFFWQLVWRAPQLEKGTTILTYGLPLQYYSDNSLTAPLNWIYAPENHSLQLPYFLAFTDVRVGASIPELKKDLPIRQRYRNAVFTGNTSDMLVVFYSPPGCLRILDPGRKADLPGMPDEIALALELSDTSRILPSTQTSIPPVTIFGSEPLPEWCYYFEKADFARQTGNWDTIVTLGNTVMDTGLTPSNPTELFPFIEGYAHTGKWDNVKSLADDAMKIDHSIQSQLCELISRIDNDLVPTTESQVEISDLQNSYQCFAY